MGDDVKMNALVLLRLNINKKIEEHKTSLKSIEIPSMGKEHRQMISEEGARIGRHRNLALYSLPFWLYTDRGPVKIYIRQGIEKPVFYMDWGKKYASGVWYS